MNFPNFNDPFNSYYDQFSIHVADFNLPENFVSYVPDNQDDYQCVSVIVPSMRKGSSAWTLNEKWITIGIYKDEGRPTSQRPSRTGTWTRSNRTFTINDPVGHKLHTGDLVNVQFDTNNPLTSVPITVKDDYNFTVEGQSFGTTAGSVVYQDDFLTDFSANYRVFRLMPSFNLLTISMLNNIFSLTMPLSTPTSSIYNFTLGKSVSIPTSSNDSTNYTTPITSYSQDILPLLRRFGQIFDASGKPLPLNYMDNGYPVNVNNVDSKFKNSQIFYNPPVVSTSDPYIYAYDFYGIPLNDSTRGFTLSTTNVTRNLTISGNLNNLTVNPSTGYVSTINDFFGNLAIGVQSNNALVTRKQILPLELDAFNLPTKNPST